MSYKTELRRRNYLAPRFFDEGYVGRVLEKKNYKWLISWEDYQMMKRHRFPDRDWDGFLLLQLRLGKF